MRFPIATLIAVLALGTSAFAENIALPSLGASAACGGSISLPNYPNICYLIYPYPSGTDYLPSNVIDGDPSTEWVAAGGTVDPYLLIDLGGLYTVDSVTVTGIGNTGNIIGFSVFTGTTSNVATLEAETPIGSVASQMGGTLWSDTFSVSTAAPIEYVLYDVTLSNGDITVGTTGSGGLDDAYATEISVDGVPEAGTFALMAMGLLVLGLTRRFRQLS
jgi:hypothetical protein